MEDWNAERRRSAVAFPIISGMDRLAWSDSQALQRTPENLRVRLIRSALAGHDDFSEKPPHSQPGQDCLQTAVEIRDHAQAIPASRQLPQHLGRVREKGPNLWLGKVGVDRFEVGVSREVGPLLGRQRLLQDALHQRAPPAFIVLRPRSGDSGPRRRGGPGVAEGVLQVCGGNVRTETRRHGPIMFAHGTGQKNQGANRVEENGLDHICRRVTGCLADVSAVPRQSLRKIVERGTQPLPAVRISGSMSKTLSDTIDTLNRLIATCKDGQEGFRLAAEAITGDEDLKQLLFSCSLQRSKFAGDLQNELVSLGEADPVETGHVAAVLHRGWLGLKSVVTHRDNHAVLAECERGEDVAVSEYRKAEQAGLPSPLGELVNTQFQEVLATHNTIRDIRDQLAAMKPTPAERVHDLGSSLQEKGRTLGASAADGWSQTKSSTEDLLHSTEIYVRENPVPAILTALGVGFAIGLLVRAVGEPSKRDHIKVPIPTAAQKVRDFDYKAAVLPFAWPVIRFFASNYAASQKSVQKAYKKAKSVDVQDYVDPVLKRARKMF
jgi:uncharacterized protein (TIGR02284 family)